ncbi:MAG: RNA methyltransferase [Pyrinomonadaceae bacterium]|nr:RNA methyltransferase [Pyrinomonadaceae bacterium]
MYNKIKSRDNQRLKNVRKIRDGKAFEKIFIEGLRLCEEALKSEIEIIECFIDEKFGNNARESALIKTIESKCSVINEVEPNLFQSIADTQNSQGIIIIGKKPQTSFKDSADARNRYLFLFEINNPSNLGAILRTAEAAGIGGVIISKNSTDAYSPKALRASMGAGFRLPIWEQADFYDALEWAKDQNLVTTAADINADRKYYEIDWSKKRLIIFGSEADGLSEEHRRSVNELIYIPMENSVESLNLAVSCGIVLFEAKK